MVPIEVLRGRKHVASLDNEVRRRLEVNAKRMQRAVARKNAKRAGDHEFGEAASKGSPSDVHVGDHVLLALEAMTAVKRKGRIAQRALMNRKGTRGRQWTQETYLVVEVRKRFGSVDNDVPRQSWKYLVEDDDVLYF